LRRNCDDVDALEKGQELSSDIIIPVLLVALESASQVGERQERGPRSGVVNRIPQSSFPWPGGFQWDVLIVSQSNVFGRCNGSLTRRSMLYEGAWRGFSL
jgi:hypothetical protein